MNTRKISKGIFAMLCLAPLLQAQVRLGSVTDIDATWINYRYLTTDSTTYVWTTPGGDYDATASASLSFSGGVAGGRYLVISSGTLQSDVALWTASPSGNNGWIAIGNESVLSSRIVVHSREATLAPFYRPRIRIFTNN
jgi:hypothetical protein